MDVWSGCANECLRSHVVSGEILSSSCEEFGDFLLPTLPWDGSSDEKVLPLSTHATMVEVRHSFSNTTPQFGSSRLSKTRFEKKNI